MSIVTLRLPEVKYCQEVRPRKCPYCEGETFQRWGGVVKRVSDPHLGEVWVYRYRCCRCRRTFRHYPVGIDRARQTLRMRALAAIGWILGMSYRGSSRYLSAFGITLSRMSIWRDVQQRADEMEQERFWKPVRVAGVDGAYVRGWGKTQPVLVVVDMGTGEPVTVGYVDEKDPRAVQRFLEPLVKRLGISVIVTDDLASYKQVAESLQLEQQICQFHVRRWVGQAVHELKESLPPEWVGALPRRCVRFCAICLPRVTSAWWPSPVNFPPVPGAVQASNSPRSTSCASWSSVWRRTGLSSACLTGKKAFRGPTTPPNK